MPRYHVSAIETCTRVVSVEVEAGSAREAVEIAGQMPGEALHYGEIQPEDMEFWEAEEVR